MSYQVIARKWRPQGFDDVFGQAHVTTALRNAIRCVKEAGAQAVKLEGGTNVAATIERISAADIAWFSPLLVLEAGQPTGAAAGYPPVDAGRIARTASMVSAAIAALSAR